MVTSDPNGSKFPPPPSHLSRTASAGYLLTTIHDSQGGMSSPYPILPRDNRQGPRKECPTSRDARSRAHWIRRGYRQMSRFPLEGIVWIFTFTMPLSMFTDPVSWINPALSALFALDSILLATVITHIRHTDKSGAQMAIIFTMTFRPSSRSN